MDNDKIIVVIVKNPAYQDLHNAIYSRKSKENPSESWSFLNEHYPIWKLLNSDRKPTRGGIYTEARTV